MYQSEPERYRGVLFDSKLEVRWARLLDLHEVAYVYHPRHAHRWPPAGDADTVVHYTPDFWLPASDQYLEVKPFDPFRDADDPRWAKEATKARRRAHAVATDAQFQGFSSGPVTLHPKSVPPITFVDQDGGLCALDHHGQLLAGAAFYRCPTCRGAYVDAYPPALAASACPCCGGPIRDGDAEVLAPPLPV